MPVSTGEIAKLLWPGLNTVFGQTKKMHPPIATTLFENNTSNKNFEEDQELIGLTVSAEKAEGAAIQFDEFKQSYNTRYVHTAYALGVTITREAIDDNLYKSQTERATRLLAKSDKEARELNGHNIFIRAFNSSYTGGDGKELLATDHPNASGGTYQNELTTAADLSEAALEEMQLVVEQWTDDKGLRINAHMKDLIIPPDLRHEAWRILKSDMRVDTANNDTNSLKDQGVVKKIIVSPYLTDTDAWFLNTDVEEGLKYFTRVEPQLENDNDFMTKDMHFSVYSRYVFGWSNPKGLVGSPGA